MSKLLANEIANYGDNAPIDIKEGLNIPAGKPLQADGISGSSGQVLSSTGNSIAWVATFDGDYNSLTNKPTIPSAQVSADWNATSGVAVILNKPTVPPLSSLTVNPVGTAALSFNAANGQFTYTPPDLSGYATTTSLTTAVANSGNWDTAYGWGNHASAGYLTSLGDAAGVTTAKITNWDTAYGWGNHASAGYLTSYTETDTLDNVLTRGASTTRDITTTGKILYSNNYANLGDLPSASTYHGMFAHVHAEGHGYFGHAGGWIQLLDTGSSIAELADVDLTTPPSSGQVLKYDGSNWTAAPDNAGSGGAGIALTDISVTTATAGSPSLSYNNVSGVFTYTPPDLSSYLTSFTETDPVFTASAASGITSSNISNWDTAYGWGNHASAGYLTSLPAHGISNHNDVTVTSPQNNQLLKYNTSLAQWENFTSDFATETWVGSQGFLTSTPEIVQGNSKAEVIGSGTDDGEFKVTLQDNTSGGAGATALRLHTDSSVNVIEFNEGNPAAKSRLVLNHLTTTNAWSEIHFKRTGASPGTSMIRSGGGGSGGYFQFYPVDGNVDFQVSGTGTYTRLNHIVGGSLTAGGLTYPTSNGNSGEVLTSDGAGNVTWQAGGSGNTQVSISDTIPAGTASAGDLWWESDTGRLKIYYQDTDSSQWVDTNPPLAPTGMSNGNSSISINDTGTNGTINFNTEGSDRWEITNAGHLLPKDHETYDIGSAEQKVRHLFLSDNSLWLGNRTRMSVAFRNLEDANIGARPTVRFYNRDVNKTPAPIANIGGTVSGCIAYVNATFPGRSGPVNADTLLLTDWTGYWSSLTGAPIGTYGVDDLYPSPFLNGDINPAYDPQDWADAMGFSQNGQERAITISSDSTAYNLVDTDTFVRVNANADFPVKIDSISTDDQTFFNMTVWISQGVTPYLINAVSFNNGAGGYDAATQVKTKGTALANNVQAFKITGIKLGGNWSVNIDIG
tara:strand:- start:6488 stop:9373 length:2886 start_codon:yes stop_codon:yes gene_type:complete